MDQSADALDHIVEVVAEQFDFISGMDFGLHSHVALSKACHPGAECRDGFGQMQYHATDAQHHQRRCQKGRNRKIHRQIIRPATQYGIAAKSRKGKRRFCNLRRENITAVSSVYAFLCAAVVQ